MSPMVTNIIYLLMVLVLVAPAVWYGYRSGKPVFRYLLIWTAVGMVVAALYYLFRI